MQFCTHAYYCISSVCKVVDKHTVHQLRHGKTSWQLERSDVVEILSAVHLIPKLVQGYDADTYKSDAWVTVGGVGSMRAVSAVTGMA